MLLEAYRQAVSDGTPRRRYPSAVWRGIVRLLAQADRAIVERSPVRRHEALMRAEELLTFLDAGFEDSLMPEAAPTLHDIHSRVLALMVQANLHDDRTALETARETARVLDVMWSEAADRASADLEGGWRSC